MAWNKTEFEEFRRLIPSFVWYACFFFVLSLLLVSHFTLVRRFPALRPFIWVTIGLVAGTTIAMAISSSRKEHWLYSILDPIPTSANQRKWYFIGLVIVAMVAFFDDWGHIRDILDHHGSLFDWIIGSLTVVGIWLTYNTITENQRIIRSFNQLQSRMLALAADTAADDSAGVLRFLAYTASIGFLALKQEQWDQMEKAFNSLITKNRFKVICLDDKDLAQWHNQYVGRQTSRHPKVGGTILNLVDTIDATRKSQDLADGPKDAEYLMGLKQPHSKKLKCEMMPGYYLMCNDRRAIIVSPFFVPHHTLAINDPAAAMHTNRVQMFGFETTDHRVIEDVSTLFSYYWEDKHQRLSHFDYEAGDLAHLTERMTEQFKNWASAAAGKGKLYRYRVLVVEEKPWDAILITLRPWVGESDFQSYLAGSESYTEDGKILVAVSAQEKKDWIESHCGLMIDQAKAKTGLDLDMPIEIVVRQAATAGVVH